MRTWLKALFGGYDFVSEEGKLDVFNTTLNVIRTAATIALLIIVILK